MEKKRMQFIIMAILTTMSGYAATKVTIDKDILLVDSVPFFALGVYFEDSTRYQELNEAGFNLINLAGQNFAPEVISTTLTEDTSYSPSYVYPYANPENCYRILNGNVLYFL